MTMSAGSELLVIARWQNGQVLKGTTHDFAPARPSFHLTMREQEGLRTIEVQLKDLKAVFFVKSFDGNPNRPANYDFDSSKGQGRRVIVTFVDGELVAGFTVGYSQGKPGFFLIPADPGDNNERVFVVNAAVKSLQWVTGAMPIPAGSSRA